MFWAFFLRCFSLWLHQVSQRANLRRNTILISNSFCPPSEKHPTQLFI